MTLHMLKEKQKETNKERKTLKNFGIGMPDEKVNVKTLDK